MRKRESMLNFLNELMKNARDSGYISWNYNNIERSISFVKDGKLNENKFSVFFGLVIREVKKAFMSLIKGELNDKQKKFLLSSSNGLLIAKTFDGVYERIKDVQL